VIKINENWLLFSKNAISENPDNTFNITSYSESSLDCLSANLAKYLVASSKAKIYPDLLQYGLLHSPLETYSYG